MTTEWRMTFPIEKAEEREDGLYITGIASGTEIDGQGERMTPGLIHKFADQINATAGLSFADRLPYRDAHTKDGVLKDLGVASKAWVDENTRLHAEVKLDEDNPAAVYLYKQLNRGKQFGMSVHGHVFGFVDEFLPEIGKAVRTFKDVILDEISNTTRPAYTPSLGTVLSKALEEDTALVIEKAVWTGAYINNLPDSSFAYIEPGGQKDSDGKTTPRELRHLPYKDENGKPDAAHVRNALARLSQTQISASAKASAHDKLVAAAKTLGIDVTQKDDAATDADVVDEGANVLTDELETTTPEAESPVENPESTEESPEVEVTKTDEPEVAPETPEVIEKAGATISAATKKHLLAMHTSAVAHLQAIEAEMRNMGVDSALGTTDDESKETTPDNESTEKTDSQDDDENTLSKTGDETPDQEPTLATENEELKKSLAEATARIQSLEANRTVLPPVLVKVEEAVDDFQKSMAELPIDARLRVAFAAHTRGQ